MFCVYWRTVGTIGTLYILYKVIDTEKAREKSHFRLNHHIGTF